MGRSVSDVTNKMYLKLGAADIKMGIGLSSTEENRSKVTNLLRLTLKMCQDGASTRSQLRLVVFRSSHQILKEIVQWLPNIGFQSAQ